ncbi:MAG: MBL fold metallo-hydrolase [Chloroflexota bacterium]|nr:MBL fold metallo-hydrolase [Chloroflexota bacterium]
MTARTYPFDIGQYKCVSISDGIQPIGAELLPTFFAGSAAEDLALAFKSHGISPDHYDLQCNCLLIDTGDARILIDSGGGPFFDPHLGLLAPGLESAGYNPGDIDIVVLTHGHRDHVCGGVSQDDSMIFPNAKHVMVRGEWEYWVNLGDEEISKMAHSEDIRFARHCLKAIECQLELIDAGEEIAPGVRTLASPGHTRNHISVEATSGGRSLICVADTMDLPIHIENTSWHPAWDELPETGIETRRALLRRAAERNALIHGYHFPFPGLGYVREAADGWRFEPYPE